MTFNRPGHPNPDPELPDGDPHLAEVLETERTGILNWLVEGAMLYLRDGLLPPSDVTNETVAFLSTQGYFYDWVKEQEVCDPKKGMRAAQLLGAYMEACKVKGIRRPMPNSIVSLGRAISKLDVDKTRDEAGIRYGLRTIDPDDII